MIEIMYIETLSSRGGDRVTIIPSGFTGSRIVIFEDYAYNINSKYLTNELYKKLVEEDKKCRLEQKIKLEEQ